MDNGEPLNLKEGMYQFILQSEKNVPTEEIWNYVKRKGCTYDDYCATLLELLDEGRINEPKLGFAVVL